MYSYSNTKNLSSIHFHSRFCALIHCFFTVTITPSTSRYLSAHQRYSITRSRGASHTLHQYKSRFQKHNNNNNPSTNFSSLLVISSVIDELYLSTYLPAICANWMMLIFTLFNDSFKHFHSLFQQLHDMSRMSGDLLHRCRHSVTNSNYSPHVSHNPSPQNYTHLSST